MAGSASAPVLSAAAPQSRPPIPTTFPPLPDVRLPAYTQVTLPNGLKVFLLEDHEVALVRGTLLMRGGQHASPPNKVGVASIAASMQRSGGSVEHPGDVLNDRLATLAAAVEVSASPQSLSADFFCLKEDTEEVVGLMSEVIRTPALPFSRLSLYRAQIRNSLEHRYDDPGAVSRRELQGLLYGRDSVYARVPTLAGVASISLDNVRDYLQTWERPDSAVIGIVGDFDSAAMTELLGRTLGKWQPAAGQPEQPPPQPSSQMPDQAKVAGRIFLVDRPGVEQASVVVGEPGIQLSDPHVYALDVLGGIFNSFGGQLFDQVRSREGLAYSVYGSWDTPPDHAGAFTGGGQTSVPGKFLVELRKVLQQATVAEPPAADLATARSESLNTFVFNFASSAAQMQRLLVYDLLGLPQDFLFQYTNKLQQVTGADVLAAAQRHLHPDQQTVVIAADAAKVLPQLRAAGFDPIPLELDPL